MLITAVVFLLILSVLVLIHEAGHYFVAKKLGIKVEEFGFGLPLTRSLFSIKRGETIYSFYPALIGGFVKLYGEDDAGAGRVSVSEHQHVAKNKTDEKRAFYSRSVGQRAAVVVAGVVMNTLLAVVIYSIFMNASGFTTALPLLGDNPPRYIGAAQTFVPKGIAIGKVSPNSPAEKAGLKAPSVLLSLNGKKITSTNELIKIINQNKGREITIEWLELNSKKRFSAKVTPRISAPKNQGAVGILFDYNPLNVVILDYKTPTQKIFAGVSHTANVLLFNIEGLKYLVGQSIREKTFQPIAQNVGGPIAIGATVGKVVGIPNLQARMLELLNLTGILSIMLAFFNVLPIPGLDGGRLFFVLIEGVVGRKIDPKIEGYINSVGMAILIVLVIVVSIKDIFQFLL